MASLISTTWRISLRNMPFVRPLVSRPFHSGIPLYRLAPILRGHSIDPADETIEESLNKYCASHSTPLPEKFKKLHESTMEHYPTTAYKTISSLQAQSLLLIMRMTRPRLVLELGCFMGYSAMAMADGMPKGSTLYTCEIDPKAAKLARELFTREGYHDGSNQSGVKIKLLEGNGMDSLKELSKQKLQFDAVFLDADKGGYIAYHDFILDNNMLSDHGYFLSDNVLFRGLVLNANDKSAPQDHDNKLARKVNAYNIHVKNDPRVTVSLLPVYDGLSIVMKK